ncbi:MAG TPA: RsmE family RNA methyltransferase [Candidatus Dormibacteraeota bacterium]|nr:RsmE family RNA methyltransferase [Candidatus Dormibacteraeota bacterium]
MPRFFVPAGAVTGGGAVISGADAAHLARSLRARPGERVTVVDDAGREHGVLLEEVGAERARGRVEWSRPATGEPRARVLVLQALPADGMDATVEALAEIGAAEIWPVLTRRTVARPAPDRAARRVERWSAIAREGAALAGRGAPVPVRAPRPLDEALAALPAGIRLLACAPGAGTPLSAKATGTALALLIGPEGGLDPEELAAVRARGGEEVHLGPRVLRSRLAGTVAVAVVLARLGELDAAAATPPVGAETSTNRARQRPEE